MERVNFNYLPWRGEENLKNQKKRVEEWYRGKSFEKGVGRGGLGLARLIILSGFITFTFRDYFIPCKIVMHLKKNYFLLPP